MTVPGDRAAGDGAAATPAAAAVVRAAGDPDAAPQAAGTHPADTGARSHHATAQADATADAAEFASYRDLLFTLSYEITASVADAEDVVQESYLRWAAMDAAERDRVVNRRAYLARIATRQALNRVRSRTRLREEYVGPWLPEPW